MRSIGLDLGARHIAYCEVRDGKVVERGSVQRLDQLTSRLGAGSPPARVAFEAAREAWHVYDVIKAWGHEPTGCWRAHTALSPADYQLVASIRTQIGYRLERIQAHGDPVRYTAVITKPDGEGCNW